MESPLEAARSLRPLIESEANAADEGLTLTPSVLDAFARTHLFHLMVPEAFGGLEADTDTILDVFEELAHQDGSIGWTHMATAAATAYVSYLDPALAREMVEDKPAVVCAGQFAPRAQVAREQGGFRVSGNFSFGSGTGHASFVGGAGILMKEDGTPELLESGMPAYLCFFTPVDRVELRGGWDVMGLRGTGSFD